jgi:teichoic acid transport system permease protein
MKKKLGKALRRFEFTSNLLRYRRYILLSVKASLKKEVAGSHLSWIWLILEPIFLTIIYGVVVSLFLRGNGLSFGVFILCGLLAMSFFKRGIMKSIMVVKNRQNLIKNLKIPKYIVICEIMGKNLAESTIAFILIIILMIIAKVEFTPYIFLFPLLFILLIVLTFSFSLFALHIGAHTPDVKKTMNMVFRLLFYASGTIFPIFGVIKSAWLVNLMIYANPLAFVMQQFRLVTIDGRPPEFLFVGLWFVAGVLLSFLGLKLVGKHEGEYAKID